MNDAREGLSKYFEFYNKKRPHQSMNYQTPSELKVRLAIGSFYCFRWEKWAIVKIV
jgi:hypothetical protein